VKDLSELRIRKPEMEFIDTVPTVNGWEVSGNVEFTIEDSNRLSVASLTFPFESASGERQALRQAAEQLTQIAKIFTVQAKALLDR
jgi:hypothetical protein